MKIALSTASNCLIMTDNDLQFKRMFMNLNAKETQDGGATRREFIKKSTLAAAAAASANLFRTPVYGQDQAPSANVAGANNRLRVGYIGTGNQGQFHIQTQKAAA